tara:strand:- start:19797 stop:20093 length:297 start_codon:yes stop_codon:yes gene_type:complete
MKIERMNKGDWGKVKAFFNVETSEGFSLKGFKLVEGINGMFVGFPSQKDKEGEYKDTIFASKELRQKLNDLAISEYGSSSSSSNSSVSTTSDFDNVPF